MMVPDEVGQDAGTAPYTVVEHTADWSLLVTGQTWPDLLVHAAEGMASLLLPEGENIPDDRPLALSLSAFDRESLLVDWLSELAFWAESEQCLFRRVVWQAVSATRLQATVWGGRVPAMQKHIKAVTYHELAVQETSHGLRATIVFDV